MTGGQYLIKTYLIKTEGLGGVLTAMSGSPFTAGTAPFLIVNHDGDHLYVADRDSGDLAEFSISGSSLYPALPLRNDPRHVSGCGSP